VLGDGEVKKEVGYTDADDQATKLKKIKAFVKATRDAAVTQKALADKARDDLSAVTQKLTAADAVLTAKDAEVAKRQEESKTTRELLAAETKKNLDAVVELNKARDDAVAQRILATSAQARLQQLAEENTLLAQDNQKLAAGGAKVVQPAKMVDNPPSENVHGRISQVGSNGLVLISLGSDAGLAKGNTLQVFRLNTQAPELSKYLGKIRITEVTATGAVAQPVGKPSGPIQVGDQVSSQILGG
jgi:hypothetical protein